MIRQFQRGVYADRAAIRYGQVAKILCDLYVFHHAGAHEGDFTVVFDSRVDHLLHPRDERGETGNDDAPLSPAEDFIQRVAHNLFRWRPARAGGVGRVGNQSQHAALRELCQFGIIRGPVIHGRVVEFIIAGLNDEPFGRFDTQTDRVGDGVAHMEKVNGEWADADLFTCFDGIQRCRFQHTAPFQLDFDQADGERCAVNGRLDLLQQVMDGADVILVAVRDDNRFDFVPAAAQVLEIRDDIVNAEHIIVREHTTGIHDDDGILVLIEHQVAANLSHSPQRDYF